MIIILVILDQITKYFANIYRPSFDVIGELLKINYVENTGTIFGLFENSNLIFIVLALILCIVISVYMKFNIPKKSLKEKGLLLILAGGVGNLIDRIFRGFVVDFISLKWVGIFNFADSYIVVGAVFLLFLELKEFWKNGEASRKSDISS